MQKRRVRTARKLRKTKPARGDIAKEARGADGAGATVAQVHAECLRSIRGSNVDLSVAIEVERDRVIASSGVESRV